MYAYVSYFLSEPGPILKTAGHLKYLLKVEKDKKVKQILCNEKLKPTFLRTESRAFEY